MNQKHVINLDSEVSEVPRHAKSAAQKSIEDNPSVSTVDARVHELTSLVRDVHQESVPIARETLATMQDGLARGDANTAEIVEALKENTAAVRELMAVLRSRTDG